MTDGWIRAIVEAIQSSPTQAVLYFSGGASQALGWLMSVPGASNAILEIVVPYSRMSMIQLLGKVPAQFTIRETAEEMALLAYNRSLKLSKPGNTVIISNQPYFYKKAELFLGSAFVIGADTAARLIDPKYYGGDPEKMLEILIGCKRTGCTFLVGGRNVDGVFKVLEDFDIPNGLKDMFISIPVDKFRMDISSTQIRKSRGTQVNFTANAT